jgi:hypothetical protein
MMLKQPGVNGLPAGGCHVPTGGLGLLTSS